ncbi:MAG: cysteine synthase family protein [Bacilli bacterium]|jgi:cysteine synthase A
MIYHRVDELIGETPILELEHIGQSTIYVKLEMFNIGGSVKDRIALQMIDDMEAQGIIKRDSKLVEATSGNTGIGLAMVCASRGISLTIIMPENMSKERQDIMKAYGAKIILSEAKSGMKGAEILAEELAKQGYIYLNQFENQSNVKAHFEHTSKEIMAEFPKGIDYLVAGVGTSGTITGLSKALKVKFPKIKMIAVEPFESAILSGEVKGPHGIQGIGAGFVPPLYNKDYVDRVIKITTADAKQCVKDLARKGLLLGISSGAAITASRAIAKENKNAKILCISADGGIKYLSTGTYE